MKVEIYTDGGADPNPGIGGWAAILRYGRHEKVLSGAEPHTTNNRMELTAAIAALQALNRRSQVGVHTDSKYLREGITQHIQRWREKNWMRKGRKPVQNDDLWRALWTLTQEHEIEWHWVKAHAGDPLNERVDQLATRARLSITPAAEIDEHTPHLFVRAACKGNPGPGGWGAVLLQEGETSQFSGSEMNTTNNRMELMAAIEGLRQLPPDCAVQVHTSSGYLLSGITRWIENWQKRGWKKKDGQLIANADLWQQLLALTADRPVRWLSAKGQANEHLDTAAHLAGEAAELA